MIEKEMKSLDKKAIYPIFIVIFHPLSSKAGVGESPSLSTKKMPKGGKE